MAKHDTSILTQVAAGIKWRIQNLMDYYEENPEKTFWLERVDKREARRRFLAMSPLERADMVAQMGIEHVAELFQKGK